MLEMHARVYSFKEGSVIREATVFFLIQLFLSFTFPYSLHPPGGKSVVNTLCKRSGRHCWRRYEKVGKNEVCGKCKVRYYYIACLWPKAPREYFDHIHALPSFFSLSLSLSLSQSHTHTHTYTHTRTQTHTHTHTHTHIYIYIYTYMLGCTRRVLVIDVGNVTGNLSSNAG